MSAFKKSCPGQNTAFLKDFNTNIIPCPKCGFEIEFFADERKVKCPKCYSNVFRVNPQIIEYKNGDIIYYDSEKSCLDWCGACIDKSDYTDIIENNKRIEKKKEDFKKLISLIDKSQKEVIEFLIEAFRKSINHLRLFDPKAFDVLQRENPDLFKKVRQYYLKFLENS